MTRTLLLALAALLDTSGAAHAQATTASLRFPVQPFTLDAVARRGTIRVAVPHDAPPFAWTTRDGAPSGYAAEVCLRAAATVAQTLNRPLVAAGESAPRSTLRLEFVRLPVAEEGAAIIAGSVDLGCSAVPPTPGANLTASPPLAVSGVRILAARLGPVSSLRDLPGAAVAVVAGTTAEATLRRLSPRSRILPVPSPGDGYELLATGGADAFVAEDLLLAGLLATRTDGPSFRIVGDPLSRTPLALLSRGDDPAFANVVRQAVERMAADGTLRARYTRWFTQPLPDGAAVDRPASRDTEAVLGPPPR